MFQTAERSMQGEDLSTQCHCGGVGTGCVTSSTSCAPRACHLPAGACPPPRQPLWHQWDCAGLSGLQPEIKRVTAQVCGVEGCAPAQPEPHGSHWPLRDKPGAEVCLHSPDCQGSQWDLYNYFCYSTCSADITPLLSLHNNSQPFSC